MAYATCGWYYVGRQKYLEITKGLNSGEEHIKVID